MPKYDIAFLGTSIAGLFAAVKLSKAGKRVIIFDAAYDPGGRAVHIDTGVRRFRAIPHPVFGFEREGLLWKLCSDAGVPEIPLMPPMPYQVILPEKRITIFPSIDATLEEIGREFPAEVDKAATIFRFAGSQLTKAAKSSFSLYLLKRRSARDYLKAFSISRELYSFFDLQSRLLCGTSLLNLRLDAFLQLNTKLPRVPQDGYSWLAEHLCDQFENNGGEIHRGTNWPGIIRRSTKITGLSTERGAIETRTVVLNAFERRAERRLLLRLRSGAIPVEIQSSLFCLPDYNNNNEVFTLTIASQGGRDAIEGAHVIYSSFFGARFQTVAKTVLFDKIADLVPFLRGFITSEDEDDTTCRRYPLESYILKKSFAYPEGGSLFVQKGMKNLYVLPDESALTEETLNASQKLTRILS